jgi:succinate dehydrogenase flavin-adding protein (antitoxin of CptAB toxin-antitoxin module)
LNQLEELKTILQNEVQDLKNSLMKNHVHEDEATDRLLSRIADRNDIMRINTLEWVLKIIAKLENR